MPLSQVALTFPSLEGIRSDLYERLQIDLDQPTMPAYLRYDGVLYRALDPMRLDQTQLAVLREKVLIQSALFGLIGATNLITSYKFSANSKVAGLDLKQAWRDAHQSVWPRLQSNIVIDMRSKAYAALAPIPESISSLTIEVIDSKTGKTISHLNKLSKGRLLTEVLRLNPATVAQLQDVATAANLKLQIDGRRGMLLA